MLILPLLLFTFPLLKFADYVSLLAETSDEKNVNTFN